VTRFSGVYRSIELDATQIIMWQEQSDIEPQRHRIFFLLFKLILSLSILSTFLYAQVGVPDNFLNVYQDGHLLTLPYYGNSDIESTLPYVKTAIISLHGDGRNASEHFNILINATTNNEMIDSTLILAPLFLLQGDLEGQDLDSTVLFWPSGDWNAGDLSRNTGSHPRAAQISSFSILDTIYHRLVTNCPNLETLTLTGHSAGSQMVVRYAAGGRAQQDLEDGNNILFRYIPTNTPSFLYLDEARVVNEYAQSYTFEIPDLCWSANYYKYGLGSLNDYMQASGVDLIRDQYFNRDITYLIGSYDTGGQSTNCARDVQGNNRLNRSYVFFGYLSYYYGDSVYSNHRLAELPSVYHEFWQVVNSECGMNTILDLGACDEYIDGPALYNAAPLADAGADQVVGFLETIVLDGSESTDLDGSITSSLWTQIGGETVNLTNQTSLMSSFTTSNQNDSLVFQLEVTDNEGSVSRDTTFITVSSSSAISGKVSRHTFSFSISPNPFNASTVISFQGSDLDQHINIYDLQGRKVFTLSQNHSLQPTSIRWDGKDLQGVDLNAGVYIINYQSGAFREIRKVTYLK